MTNTAKKIEAAQHTPGPWFIWGHQIKAEAGGWQQKEYIAEIPNHTGAEESANARLIAAAPELLEALLTAEAELENHTDVPGVAQHVLPCIRAAIAKARGQV